MVSATSQQALFVQAGASQRQRGPLAAIVLALAVGAAPGILLALLVGRGGTASPWLLPLAMLTLMVNVIIVVMDLRYGLALFIVAAGLSPKLPGLYNNLRAEDFVFCVVLGAWALKWLYARRFPRLRSPIILPFILLTVVSLLSTLMGLGLRVVPDWQYSLFLQVKRIEYFLIFWVVATSVRNEAWLRALTMVFVASGALAAIYGLAYAQNDHYVTVAQKRVIGPEGENYNTLAGYLVVCIAVALAVLPGFPKSRQRAFLIGGAAIAVLGLLLSFSREGYIMLMGSLLIFGFTRHRLILLGAGLALVAAFTLAQPMRANVADTVIQIQQAHQEGVDTGSNSLAARYQAWKWRWNDWFLKRPVLGSGVGSVALSVDNEYLLRACEVGFIGFALFLWWLAAVGRMAVRLVAAGGFARLLGLGLAAGFVGLLIQGWVAASFTTIRTMEPFWYLLGLVAAAAAIQQRDATVARAAPSREAISRRPRYDQAPDRGLRLRRRAPVEGS
jgi:hypothetical protein